MEAVTGPIEETVEMTRTYPSVTERYFTKYYYIPKERKKQVTSGDGKSQNVPDDDDENSAMEKGNKNCEDVKENATDNDDNGVVDDDAFEEDMDSSEISDKEQHTARVMADSTGHVCVMVHSNKLCLVTLSHKHPILAHNKEITQVSYEVGKFNRLENQVSGKGKRGAQMMGPQSPVCLITCSDGSRYSIMAGIHGKLVEVNERLLENPKLVTERPDAEGYLAVVLPPLRNADNATAKLLTAEEYQRH